MYLESGGAKIFYFFRRGHFVRDPVIEVVPFREPNCAWVAPFGVIGQKNFSRGHGKDRLFHFGFGKFRGGAAPFRVESRRADEGDVGVNGCESVKSRAASQGATDFSEFAANAQDGGFSMKGRFQQR